MRKEPFRAIFTGESGQSNVKLNYGQTGEAQVDSTRRNSVAFVPDGTMDVIYVHSGDLYIPNT